MSSRFLFAVALTAMLLAAVAPGARADTRDFDAGWRFALVNPTDTTDPTGAYANAMNPSL